MLKSHSSSGLYLSPCLLKYFSRESLCFLSDATSNSSCLMRCGNSPDAHSTPNPCMNTCAHDQCSFLHRIATYTGIDVCMWKGIRSLSICGCRLMGKYQENDCTVNAYMESWEYCIHSKTMPNRTFFDNSLSFCSSFDLQIKNIKGLLSSAFITPACFGDSVFFSAYPEFL